LRRPLATLTAVVLLATGASCDDPPPRNPQQVDIDAESKTLEERVEKVREEADERVASPDASSQTSD
jgi:hypothetical protein